MVVRRGLGLITSSNFYVPQVNLPGSMANFVTPAGIPIVVSAPPALHGSVAPGVQVNPVGSVSVTTNWLPWVIGGVLLVALFAGGRR